MQEEFSKGEERLCERLRLSEEEAAASSGGLCTAFCLRAHRGLPLAAASCVHSCAGGGGYGP